MFDVCPQLSRATSLQMFTVLKKVTGLLLLHSTLLHGFRACAYKHSKWANRPISYVIRDQNDEERPEVYNARYCYLKYEVVVSSTRPRLSKIQKLASISSRNGDGSRRRGERFIKPNRSEICVVTEGYAWGWKNARGSWFLHVKKHSKLSLLNCNTTT